jgi:hypothetical protein
VHQFAAPTAAALLAIAARRADRHAFTLAPTLHTLAQRVDAPGDLVTRRERELQTRPLAVDEDRIGVADAASLHGDPHSAGCRIGQCSIDKGQSSSR